MKSVLQKEKECFVCKTTSNLQSHHVFGGNKNRKISEKHGLKVWLCINHHTGTNEAAHRNAELDQNLKKMAQRYYECHIGPKEQFMAEFGRNYL